jgi:predicted ATPase
MDPQIRRRRTFEALKKLLLRESLNQPLILIFEDLHWIDTETQGFLDVLSESIASARILLLVNYRPEYRQEWGQKTYYTQLRLAPFGKAEAEEFLTALLGESGSPLPRGERARERVTEESLHTLKHLILEKTEGTPFFMEEVVQTLAEESVLAGERGHYQLTQHAPTLHIPPTVQGVLAARIDRLAPEEKALLQQLAVIGREFPLSLIRQVIPQPEAELYRVLAALQHKEFLYEQPAFPEVEYLFKHALTQEVAYNSVLIERRKVLHEQTGQAIEQLYPNRLEEYYDELAHHYSRSGNTEKAIEYLHLAGQQAMQRSANVKAIAHLTAALDLLKTLPDTPKRPHQELDLQATLGAVLVITRGYAAPEVGTAYTRARQLCQQVGESPQVGRVLRGLWGFYVVRGELTIARDFGEQILRLAHRAQDSSLLVEGYYALGGSLMWMGELDAAQQQVEQGITVYDPQKHRSHAFLYGQDPGVFCMCYAAMVLWSLGYPDQGLKKAEEALTFAQEISHPYSLSMALLTAGVLHYLRREGQLLQRRVEAALALSGEQGFPYMLAFGTIYRGGALAEQGKVEDGIVQIRQGIAACRATGTEGLLTIDLAMLAEAQGWSGKSEEGLGTLAEALEIVRKTREGWWEAELYRLYGELSLRIGEAETGGTRDKKLLADSPLRRFSVSSPEECFQKAIEVAQKQQAKSLELRAVMSLARLWQQQGKRADARQRLAEIYGWFTEGFDTKDLQEARTLLTVLVGREEKTGEVAE